MKLQALLLLTIVFPIACRDEPRRAETPPENEVVTTLVREFGGKLQHVSLLAPAAVVEQSMREHYAPFVAPALLERWIENPASAPGRRVSSPWPDRIEIGTITRETGDRYAIDGEVVEVTSDRAAADHRIPVRLVVERSAGAWRITDYRADDGAYEEDGSGPAEAVAVIEAYYAAIDRRDYERAYRYWSSEGKASGQTLEEFRKGFAETAAVAVETGAPGRIDPAAGSRYVEVPVEITARTAGGEQRFRGRYVLRRSVVEGATAEQRRWRIASAEISRVAE